MTTRGQLFPTVLGSCGGYKCAKGIGAIYCMCIVAGGPGSRGSRANKHNLYNYMYIIICNILCTHFLNRTVLSVHD